MIERRVTGWQTTLADLSLILFMVTASAVTSSAVTPTGDAAAHGPSPRGEPTAVYRPGPAAPPLGLWLSAQPPDPRQQLTITATYAPGTMARALAEARQLAEQAGALGDRTRIVVEPGPAGLSAVLAYDLPSRPTARSLQPTLQTTPARSTQP